MNIYQKEKLGGGDTHSNTLAKKKYKKRMLPELDDD